MSLNSDADFSDIIADVKNIISSDTNEIHLSKSFVDEFALTKKDFDTLSASMRFDSGMTDINASILLQTQRVNSMEKSSSSIDGTRN